MNDNELVVEREMFSLYRRKYLLSDYVWSFNRVFIMQGTRILARVFASESLWF